MELCVFIMISCIVLGQLILFSSAETDAEKEVAEYYALPVCDLWSTSGIQPNVPVIKEMYCPDGLHPNDAGQELLAERIANFILNL